MDVSLRGSTPVYTRMAHDGRHGDNSLLKKHIDADTFICCPVPVDSPVASVRPPPCATARSPRLAISGRQASAVSHDALGLAGLRCQPVATARGLGTQEFPPGSGVPGICRDQHSQPCGERPGLRISGASECLVSSGLRPTPIRLRFRGCRRRTMLHSISPSSGASQCSQWCKFTRHSTRLAAGAPSTRPRGCLRS